MLTDTIKFKIQLHKIDNKSVMNLDLYDEKTPMRV